MDARFDLKQVDEVRWLLPKQDDMRTDGLVFATEAMLADVVSDSSLKQVANVATLPGIVGYSMAMPDMHEGYGFPIGGVAAFDLSEGIISPGGVGYDINCGVRMMVTRLEATAIKDSLQKLADAMFSNVPCGVGSKHAGKGLSEKELNKALSQGAGWAVSQGFGTESDLAFIEDRGCMDSAEPGRVSATAKTRGAPQLGTLGSGNHFVEIGIVVEIFDTAVADRLGLFNNQVAITIHTGSRGLGYQVCSDYLPKMFEAARKYGVKLHDRQLACAPVQSKEGKDYFGAMAASANFAFANRQIIASLVSYAVSQALSLSPKDIGLRTIYDVAHNIAKIETHKLADGSEKKLCVHRKGATRAFPKGHPVLPAVYRDIGQPVLIPGDMGRQSFLLIGSEGAMQETFGSACHGAGRVLSREAAKRQTRGRSIQQELESAGIFVRYAGRETLREEAPEAYKNVADVVDVVAKANLAKPIARLRPLAVIKG